MLRISRSETNEENSIEILNIWTGDVLKKISTRKFIYNFGCEKTLAYDQDWIATFCGSGLDLASDIMVFDVRKKSSLRFLDRVPGQQRYHYPLAIKSNKIYTILDDGTIPIWNAKTGILLTLVAGGEPVQDDVFRRIFLTDHADVVFSGRIIRIYEEVEDPDLQKTCQKSLVPIRGSNDLRIQSVVVMQNTAVVAYVAREKIHDYLFLEFLHLNPSFGRNSK